MSEQQSSADSAVEGRRDAIVQLIHKHVGVRQRVNVDLTGVEDAADAILRNLTEPQSAPPADRSDLASKIASKMAEPAFQEFAKNIPQLRELRYLPILQSSTAGVSSWWVILPSGKEICIGEGDWNAASVRSQAESAK
jgi:hypothetical protein